MNWGNLVWSAVRYAVGIGDVLLGLAIGLDSLTLLKRFSLAGARDFDPDISTFSQIAAPLLLVVAAIFCVSSVGALLRSKASAVVLLMCLAVFMFVGLLEGAAEIHAAAARELSLHWPTTIADGLQLVLNFGFGWVAWMAVNLACFAPPLISNSGPLTIRKS
jgi:hypothetical protein